MRSKLLISSAVLMFAMAACAGAPASTPTPAGPQVVNVELTNFGFKFTPGTVKPGAVKFVVKNASPDTMHELLLVKTDLALDKLPLDGEKNIDEEARGLTEVGAVEDVDPGQGGEMAVTLQPGRYVYFCNKPGHYLLGMRGEFNVAP